jgi:hypothetical protein
MTLGRRSLFFGALAGVSLLLWEPTPPEYRWVNLFAAALALLWGVAVGFEDRALGRWRPTSVRRRKPDPGPDDPVTRA